MYKRTLRIFTVKVSPKKIRGFVSARLVSSGCSVDKEESFKILYRVSLPRSRGYRQRLLKSVEVTAVRM